MHDAGYVSEGDEDAEEDKDGGFEVWQEKDGGEVDGHDGKAHVAVKLASDDLQKNGKRAFKNDVMKIVALYSFMGCWNGVRSYAEKTGMCVRS